MFIASDPYVHIGEVLDTGQCLRHCQIVADVTHSSTLRRGAKVRGGNVARGTCVGTFDEAGHYANATDGSSHVALFVKEQPDGILVIDAWSGQPVHERLIRFKNGIEPACDDADQFFVVETA